MLGLCQGYGWGSEKRIAAWDDGTGEARDAVRALWDSTVCRASASAPRIGRTEDKITLWIRTRPMGVYNIINPLSPQTILHAATSGTLLRRLQHH